MSFLTMTQGDPVGIDLLKKVVTARYGNSPPAMDALRITYEGQSDAKIGPFPLKANAKAVVTYRFPYEMKWHFSLRVLRIFRSSYTTSFDGESVYERQGVKESKVTDEALVESARRRVWAETVSFVSPLLSDHNVQVKGIDLAAFTAAAPGFPEIIATVRVNDDHTMHAVEIDRMDPTDKAIKKQMLLMVGDMINVDGLILPSELRRTWEGEGTFMVLHPVQVEMNPELSENEFRLEQEDLLAGIRDEDDE